MEIENLECRVFRKEYTNLHTGLRNTVGTVVQTCFSKFLIPAEINNIAGNPAEGLDRDARTKTFLNAVQDRIKLKSSELYLFIEILEQDEYTKPCAENLREGLTTELELLETRTKEREKRAQQQQQVVSATNRARYTQIQNTSGNINSQSVVTHIETSLSTPGDDLTKLSSPLNPQMPVQFYIVPSTANGSATQPPTSLTLNNQTQGESSKLVAGSTPGIRASVLRRSRNHTGSNTSTYRGAGGSFSGPAIATDVRNSAPFVFGEAMSNVNWQPAEMSPLVFSGNYTGQKCLQTMTPMRTHKVVSGFISHPIRSPGTDTHQHQTPTSGSVARFPGTNFHGIENEHPEAQPVESDANQLHNLASQSEIHEQKKPHGHFEQSLLSTDESCYGTIGGDKGAILTNHNVDQETSSHSPASYSLPPPNIFYSSETTNLQPHASPTNHENHPVLQAQICRNMETDNGHHQAAASSACESQLKGTCVPLEHSTSANNDSKVEGITTSRYSEGFPVKPSHLTLPNQDQRSLESSITSVSSYKTAPSSPTTPTEDCGVNPIQESQLSSTHDKEYAKLVAPSGPGAIPVGEDQKKASQKCQCQPCEICAEHQQEIKNFTVKVRTLERTLSQSREAQDKQVKELKAKLFASEQDNYELNQTVDDREKRHLQAQNDIVALHQKLQELMAINQELSLENEQLVSDNRQLNEEIRDIKVEAHGFHGQNEVERSILENQQLREENKELKVEAYDCGKEKQQLKKENRDLKVEVYDLHKQYAIAQKYIEHMNRQIQRVNSMQCPVVYRDNPDFSHSEQFDGFSMTDGNISHI